MAFVVRECPGNQYSVTGLDEFDQPIGTWSELVEFARSVLAADAALHALRPWRCTTCGETDQKMRNGRCRNVPASEHTPAADAATAALSSADPGVVDVPLKPCDCEGGCGIPHRRGSGDCYWC